MSNFLKLLALILPPQQMMAEGIDLSNTCLEKICFILLQTLKDPSFLKESVLPLLVHNLTVAPAVQSIGQVNTNVFIVCEKIFTPLQMSSVFAFLFLLNVLDDQTKVIIRQI
ncbi:hypothetical protein AMECASPLE_021608 [Ameca splendens]|uniref:Uncharacterized protein n=1 Tax=Ameca splendens TaxID=208324 RepID=A0ABV0Z2G9_9TELE